MNWAPMNDTASFVPEDFLASPADLVSVLAHLAGSTNLLSSRRRRDQRLVEAALSKLLGNYPHHRPNRSQRLLWLRQDFGTAHSGRSEEWPFPPPAAPVLQLRADQAVDSSRATTRIQFPLPRAGRSEGSFDELELENPLPIVAATAFPRD
jgi:hypothetical protein